jgi:predicted O-methyltransferase YrrM
MLKPHVIEIKTIIKNYLPIRNLTKKPYANEQYLSLWQEAKKFMRKNAPGALPLSKLEWIDNLALIASVTIKQSLPNWLHGYILYEKVYDYSYNSENSTINYFETGTAKGFSAVIASKAIIDAGKVPNIISIDIIKNDKKMYWNAINDIYGKRDRGELLSEYTEEFKHISFISMRSSKLTYNTFQNLFFDFIFLDGAHTYKSILHEFNILEKQLRQGGQILFDDVNSVQYPGVVHALNKIGLDKIEFITIKDQDRKYALYTKS